MRAIWLFVCIPMMCGGCALMRGLSPEPPPAASMPPPSVQVAVSEPIDCPISKTPVPEEARAANAADASTEELNLEAAFVQLADRFTAVLNCHIKHNEDAKRDREGSD